MTPVDEIQRFHSSCKHYESEAVICPLLQDVDARAFELLYKSHLTCVRDPSARDEGGESVLHVSLIFKRMFDVLFSVIAIAVSAPFLIAVTIAIKLDSPGSALYCAPRVGKNGRVFTCFKFRTMKNDSHLQKEQLRHLNERKGPFFKIAADPRITRVGKWLRKYSLDEIPQFLNVIRGEMSLVGPRPHPVDDCKHYDVEHLSRLDVWPGLTGLWQVSARRDPSFEKSIALDLEYIKTWSLWLDIKILLKTLPEVVRASGD